jgi:hypothetical protein
MSKILGILFLSYVFYSKLCWMIYLHFYLLLSTKHLAVQSLQLSYTPDHLNILSIVHCTNSF